MVAVIIPVFQIEKYLNACIKSVVAQSYKAIRIILVDDGSFDSSAKICEDWCNIDDRIVVLHKKNGGLSSARNAGLDAVEKDAKIEYIYFLDGDDTIHPRTLEWLLLSMRMYSTPIGSTRLQYVKEGDSPKLFDSFSSNPLTIDDFWLSHPIESIVSCGKLYRKELWSAIRFPIGKLHEDEYTTYQVLFRADRIAALSAPCYYYLQRAESITGRTWSKRRLDVLDAKRNQILFFSKQGKEVLLYDVMVKYIKAMAECLAHLDGAKDPEGYAIRRLLKDELVRVNSIKKIPVGSNYAVYHVCQPWAVNKVTWPFIRFCYLLRTEDLPNIIMKLAKRCI
ncbi:MAG: glycosyltransferase [Kiritimatiellae bacterium]|nr:glycosyltransferase [Kiritimatiellia bacterium]